MVRNKRRISFTPREYSGWSAGNVKKCCGQGITVPASLHLGEEIGEVGCGQTSQCLVAGLILQGVKTHCKFLGHLKT